MEFSKMIDRAITRGLGVKYSHKNPASNWLSQRSHTPFVGMKKENKVDQASNTQ
mgnify:CR=1 FL=1|jgi:hypothetical protein